MATMTGPRATSAAGRDEWTSICAIDDIPLLGSRVVRTAGGDIAVFRNAADEIFAVHDRCPHRGGPLSQGIVHGREVTCPLHGLRIDLASGQAVAPDTGCTRRVDVRLEDRRVLLRVAAGPRND
ncbi:MAG TPA: nitrite reductase small subunit NirD [Burkholderiaceae bacterium]|nr:nitrite reductase small subunit NirD [Burkholderiaceae bacterium]